MNKLSLTIMASAAALAFGNTWAASTDGAVAQARAQIKAHAADVRASAGDAYAVRDVILDANGAQHVRFDRSYRGLRVIGGDFVVHSNARGGYAGVSQTLSRVLALGTDAAFPEADAIRVAESAFDGRRQGDAVVSKVIYARGAQPELAYDVVLRGTAADGAESIRHQIVGANTLVALEAWDDVNTAAAAGTGNSLTSGVVPLVTNSIGGGGYELKDPSRGNGYVIDMRNTQVQAVARRYTDSDNVWGDFTNNDRATVAVDAAYGVGLTWDYYQNKFGRNGIANDGVGALSRVHFSRDYVNASWSNDCFCMTFGDGDGSTYLPLVALDVAGHEMTHGVTSRTAGLVYSDESGGLNEGISDIFGTLVEFYANNSFNTPNYLIGERIYATQNGTPTPTQALRYMFKPSLDGISPDCYRPNIGRLNVHYSSGVLNHFFYLLTQGAAVPAGFSTLTPAALVCDGNTALTPVSRDQAAQIVYRALTVYMTSSTNYAGARVAMLNAATDLFGAASPQYAAVAAAWTAVSVN